MWVIESILPDRFWFPDWAHNVAWFRLSSKLTGHFWDADVGLDSFGWLKVTLHLHVICLLWVIAGILGRRFLVFSGSIWWKKAKQLPQVCSACELIICKRLLRTIVIFVSLRCPCDLKRQDSVLYLLASVTAAGCKFVRMASSANLFQLSHLMAQIERVIQLAVQLELIEIKRRSFHPYPLCLRTFLGTWMRQSLVVSLSIKALIFSQLRLWAPLSFFRSCMPSMRASSTLSARPRFFATVSLTIFK